MKNLRLLINLIRRPRDAKFRDLCPLFSRGSIKISAAAVIAVIIVTFLIILSSEILLWKYPFSNDNSLKCTYSGFIGSCTPQKYIMPDNSVVKYYGQYLMINDRGELEWVSGNPFGLYGLFINHYEQNYSGYNDYWENPDYYLTHGRVGDCAASAFAVASILESKGVKTKIVGGWLTYNSQRVRDWIVEYKINSIYYRYFGGVDTVGFIPRNLFESDKEKRGIDFQPVLMFDKDSYYGNYNENW